MKWDYMNKYLFCVWESCTSDEREVLAIEFIPQLVLASPRSKGEFLEVIIDLNATLKYSKGCYESRSYGNLVVVDYPEEINKNNDIYIGAMALTFNSISKESLTGIAWHGKGAETMDNIMIGHDSTFNACWVDLPYDPKELLSAIDANNDVKDAINKLCGSLGWENASRKKCGTKSS
jgi:hypothetical protein